MVCGKGLGYQAKETESGQSLVKVSGPFSRQVS